MPLSTVEENSEINDYCPYKLWENIYVEAIGKKNYEVFSNPSNDKYGADNAEIIILQDYCWSNNNNNNNNTYL